MGKIFINNLQVTAFIGCCPAERERRQCLRIDLELETDFAAPAASDDLADAVDYSEIERRVAELVTSSACHLVETLASRIVSLLLEDARIARCRVRITKPGGARIAESVTVELEGGRDGHVG